MPAKVNSARRCADLLAALARTANVRLALRECGISHYWAYRQRKLDRDFDARWRTAVRNGRRALARAAAARAVEPAAPRAHARGEMVVGSSGKGTIRLERAKPCSFTPEKQARFLSALRTTSNVRAAAAVAGVSPHGAYDRYHADAEFRAEWVAALGDGRVHLEMALMAEARAAAERPRRALVPGEEPPAITGMDAKTALQLLRLRRSTDAGGRPYGMPVKSSGPEAARRSLLAKSAAVRTARARDGERDR